jgi:Leucine-rich repeat (LRR) protein
MKKISIFLMAVTIIISATFIACGGLGGKKISMITESQKISLGLAGNGEVSVTWGDGEYEKFTLTSDVTTIHHKYPSGGGHTVTLKGNITSLNCSSNSLTNLDISKNTELSYLDCGSDLLSNLNSKSNKLNTLDVSKNTALIYLNCDYNQLTNLNISKNTMLTKLSCIDNQLTSLNVSKNTVLTELLCSSNQLLNLDISKNPELTILKCYNCKLSNLDISKNTALKDLWCGSNQLSNLDISKNTALTNLWCEGNQLSNLDVSKNTALSDLRCERNQLINLDLSKNTKLAIANCENNNLSEASIMSLINSLSIFTKYGFYDYGKIFIRDNPGSPSIDYGRRHLYEEEEIVVITRSKNWRVSW